MPLSVAEQTVQILKDLHLSPNKLLGQNFLLSSRTAEKIARAAGPESGGNILEIGPGLGALSELLAQSAASLSLLELDEVLCAHLRRFFAAAPGVEVMAGDALCFDYAAHAAKRGWQEYFLVSNLPYYLTSPLLRHLLLYGGPWRRMTLMMQREVAQKLVAPLSGGPGEPLSLLLEYFGAARVEFLAPPGEFFPPPKVVSAVLVIERRDNPPFPLQSVERFERFLMAAFTQRRKTLLNSLGAALGCGREPLRQALSGCRLAENCRAEQLSLAEFHTLFSAPPLKEYV